MDHEEDNFQEFFAERLKQKGFSLKKLSDVTGIAPAHIETILRGDFENMPSAPYFRGYLIRLGKVLDFDGEEWWEKLKNGDAVKNSGELDRLPRNRFLRKSPLKFIWAGAALLIVLIYLAFQAPHIFGKPSLVITTPSQATFTSPSNTFTIQGTVHNADSLSLNGDPIVIAADGSWQKGVLLNNGLNSFQIVAKKFLGGESDFVQQILYQSPAQATSTATSTASGTPAPPIIHIPQNTPATGTYYQ